MSLFANNPKAFCVEIGEHTVLVAKISQKTPPLVVEEIMRFDREDQEGLQSYLKEAQGKGPTGFAHSICSLYPEQRVIRRQTIDPKRIKDGSYFGELLTTQLRIDKDNVKGEVKRIPTRDEIAPIVNEQLIVELYSR